MTKKVTVYRHFIIWHNKSFIVCKVLLFLYVLFYLLFFGCNDPLQFHNHRF